MLEDWTALADNGWLVAAALPLLALLGPWWCVYPALVFAGAYLRQRLDARQESAPPEEREAPRAVSASPTAPADDASDSTPNDAPYDAVDAVARCSALMRSNLEEESNAPDMKHRKVLEFASADHDVFERFWTGDFYPRLLEEKLANEGVDVSAWKGGARVVRTKHPLATNVSLPGLSFCIPTLKNQRVVEAPGCRLAIFEASCFEKIPYAAALTVETTWLFGDDDVCRVYYRCVFDAEVLSIPFWIQRLCVSQTKEELKTTYQIWIDAAAEARRAAAEPGTPQQWVDAAAAARPERRGADGALVSACTLPASGLSSPSLGTVDSETSDTYWPWDSYEFPRTKALGSWIEAAPTEAANELQAYIEAAPADLRRYYRGISDASLDGNNRLAADASPNRLAADASPAASRLEARVLAFDAETALDSRE